MKKTNLFTTLYLMMVIYGTVMIFDFYLTYVNVVVPMALHLEANNVCAFFITNFGMPYNLLVPFFILALILSFNRTQKLLIESKGMDIGLYMFSGLYFIILLFITAHIRGIESWVI